jgi:hypothetical protein
MNGLDATKIVINFENSAANLSTFKHCNFTTTIQQIRNFAKLKRSLHEC